MKIFLSGRIGQLGWELEHLLAPLGTVAAFDQEDLDITRSDLLRAAIRETRPDVIVNAAAYTAVDRAEDERELAFAVNAGAPRVMAEEAGRLGALVIHYSTDYVFDGAKPAPYTEEDAPNPINVYGESKLAGEQGIRAAGCRHFIFRTSWLYASRGSNFFLTMLRLIGTREALDVVDDQIGAPTWSRELAQLTLRVLERDAGEADYGTYHLTGSGATSWYGFARAIAERAEAHGLPAGARLDPIPASEYPTKAKRPANSRLCMHKARSRLTLQGAPWEASLEACFADYLAPARASAGP